MAVKHAISLKLPTFWTCQPQVGFAQAEAQFNIRGITVDETKYFYVLSALDQGTATYLLDLISLPPPDSKYTALKERLLETLLALANRRGPLGSFIFNPLGDTEPSALMEEMLAQLADPPPCLLVE